MLFPKRYLLNINTGEVHDTNNYQSISYTLTSNYCIIEKLSNNYTSG